MRQSANWLVRLVVISRPCSRGTRGIGSRPRSRGSPVVAPRAVSSPLGFSPASRTRQLEAETKAQAVPTPENARKWLKTLTEEPHVAGTPADYKTALFVRDRLREWGWKAELVPYEVLLNYPDGKTSARGSASPSSRTCRSKKPPSRPTRTRPARSAFGAFHGYGISGVAAGQVVYANYARARGLHGTREDGHLRARTRSCLARYGGNFRGLKVLNAQKRGAKGILIYSDPGDDGYAKGDVYPDGPVSPRLGDPARERSVPFSGPRRSLDARWSVGEEANACRSIADGFAIGDRCGAGASPARTGKARRG